MDISCYIAFKMQPSIGLKIETPLSLSLSYEIPVGVKCIRACMCAFVCVCVCDVCIYDSLEDLNPPPL